MIDDITNDEKRAIASLRRLAKRWPQTLQLWTCGEDQVMVYHRGEDRDENDRHDNDAALATIDLPIAAGDPWS